VGGLGFGWCKWSGLADIGMATRTSAEQCESREREHDGQAAA
jgi:hypothetical protein